MRADLILDCGAAPGSRHRVTDNFYRQRAYRLLDLAYSGEAPVRSRPAGPPPALAPNPVPEPDLARAERHRVRFEGGMMGRMPIARGRSCVIEFVNDTAWHHPIHLHGHVFRVLTRNGRPLPRQEWADTVLLDPESRAEIAFVADNPGDWMLHCHVLEHQASGMMAVVRVA